MYKRIGCLMVVMSIQAASVRAADAPGTQEGLWEIRTGTVQNPGNAATESTVRVCRDRAYDKYIEELARYRTGCTSATTNTADNTVKVVSRCVSGQSVVASASTVSVQSDTIHAETRRTFNPDWGGVSEEIDTQDQKLIGPCPANLRSGGVESAEKH